MESVVTEGTAGNAQVAGYAIGGKTGTSEKIDVFDENGNRVDDKIVSFIGVAPINDPQYVVLVALDTPSNSYGVLCLRRRYGSPHGARCDGGYFAVPRRRRGIYG